MKHILVFSCLLAVTSGAAHHGNFNVAPDVGVRKREETTTSATTVTTPSTTTETSPSATSAVVYQLINETLGTATEGIRAKDLIDAVDSIQIETNAVLLERGANVSRDAIKSLLNDIADQSGITISPDIILDDPLTTEAKYIGIEFVFLQKLREQGLSREAAGESTDVLLATIAAVSEALERSVSKTEGIVKFLEAASQSDDVTGNGGDGDADDNATGAELKRGASLDDNFHRNKRGFFGVSFDSSGNWEFHLGR